MLVALLAAGPALSQEFPVDGQLTPSGVPSGLPVDNTGGPTIDPTKNVLDLVRAESKYQDAARLALHDLMDARIDAEVRRQDDLRQADARLSEQARLDIERRADDLRQANTLRSNDLREAAAQLSAANLAALQREADIRAKADEQVRVAETERINKIREVDATAARDAVLAASDLAKGLALRVDASAKVLSDAVAAAQTAATENLGRVEARIASAINDQGTRITTLEQAQSQNVGRSTVADPALAQLIAQVQAIAAQQQTGSGKDQGEAATIAFIFAGIAALIGLVGLFVAFSRRHEPVSK